MWQTQPTFPLILQKSLNSISGNVITFLLNDRVCCKHLAVLQKSHEEQQPSSPHPHQGWAAQLPAAYFSKVITTGDALKQMIYQGSFLSAAHHCAVRSCFISAQLWELYADIKKSGHSRAEKSAMRYAVLFLSYLLVEKDTLTGWFILKVKWVWWMVSKKALLNFNPSPPLFIYLFLTMQTSIT